MKEATAKKIVNEFSSYAWVKPIFYRRESSPILAGLCVTKSSYEVEIYLYVQPLYDDYGFIHLSYSQVIEPRHKVKTIDQNNENDIETGVVRLLRAAEATIVSLSTVSGFVDDLERRFRYLTSDVEELPGADKVRYTYAVSLVLEDRLPEAIFQFDRIVNSGGVSDIPIQLSTNSDELLHELDPDEFIEARLGRQGFDVRVRASLLRELTRVAPERAKAWLLAFAESNRMLILSAAALKPRSKKSK